MGNTYYILNLDKKQYISPWAFSESDMTRTYLQGRDHAQALAMLMCDPSLMGTGKEPILGAWRGDRVVAVTECDGPNGLGIKTETEEEPARNLYMMCWQELEDISGDAMLMLCEQVEGHADRWAMRIADELGEDHNPPGTYSSTLWYLGNALAKHRCRELRDALEAHVGPDWNERYLESRAYYEEHLRDE